MVLWFLFLSEILFFKYKIHYKLISKIRNMTRFARAKGSKASNEKTPDDGTPWEVMKEQLLKAKQESEEAKKRLEAEKQRVENYEKFLMEQKVQKRKAEWCDFPEAEAKKKKDSPVQVQQSLKAKNKNKKNKQNGNVASNKKLNNKNTSTNELHKNNIISEESDNLDGLSNTQSKEQALNKKKKKNKKKLKNNIENTQDSSTVSQVENNESKKECISEEGGTLNSLSSTESKGQPPNKKKKKNKNKSKTNIENKQESNQNDIEKLDNNKNKTTNGTTYSTEPKTNTSYSNNKNSNKQLKKKKNKLIDGKPIRRKEINDRSFQLIINGKAVELMRFEGFPIMKKDAERLAELKNSMMKKGIPKSEVQRTIKLERRRAEKALARLRREVCYNCRKGGHNLSDCPDLKSMIPGVDAADGVCFKCGSTEHRQSECKVQRDKEFRFATCFICKESGHIARQCPDNPKGLYPNGGCCKLCGDVTHLRKDCPTINQKKEETSVKLSTLDSTDNIEDIDVKGNSSNVEDIVKKPKKIKF